MSIEKNENNSSLSPNAINNSPSGSDQSNARTTLSRFEFTGTGKEYFGIWIVNILLSIITLGIYSAWAKVRNKQYFYGNTFLDGSSFEYTASPKQILKGRILAVLFFVLYNIIAAYSAVASVILLLGLFVLTPWVIMKSLAFNARFSQYRNIRFGFQQNLRQSAVVYILIPLLMFLPLVIFGAGIGAIGVFFEDTINDASGGAAAWIIALMILGFFIAPMAVYPYFMYRVKRYIADNHRYGGSEFNFRLDTAKPFYILYLKAALIPLALLLLVFSITFFSGGVPDFLNQTLSYQTQNCENTVEHSDDSSCEDLEQWLDASTGTSQLDLSQLSEEELAALETLGIDVAELESLGLTNEDLADLGLQDYQAEDSETNNSYSDDESYSADGSYSDDDGQDEENGGLAQPSPLSPFHTILLLLSQLVTIALYIYLFAYIAANTYNLVYQNTLVGTHLLRAKMQVNKLAMIYFTNTLGILLTLGLFIPWAKVRTARYRAESTALQVDGDLDNFIAAQEEQQNVFGEEFGEVFDIDVGI